MRASAAFQPKLVTLLYTPGMRYIYPRYQVYSSRYCSMYAAVQKNGIEDTGTVQQELQTCNSQQEHHRTLLACRDHTRTCTNAFRHTGTPIERPTGSLGPLSLSFSLSPSVFTFLYRVVGILYSSICFWNVEALSHDHTIHIITLLRS